MSYVLCMTAVLASVCCLAATATAVAAYGETIEIVTSRGNVFVVDMGPSGGPDTADDDGGSNSMIGGLGINSRLVHHGVAGTMIHGPGTTGTEESLRPYTTVPSDTRFVAILEDDGADSYPVPDAYSRYEFVGGALERRTAEPANILGYADARTVHGSVDIVVDDDGITLSGEGRIILRLHDTTEQIHMRGQAGGDTVMRVVHSPYDLMAIPHTGKGFLVNNMTSDPGTSGLEVLVGSVDDSVKSANFEFVQEASLTVYHGKCCKGRYVQTGSHEISTPAHLIIQAHPSGYHAVTGDTTDPWTMDTDSIKRPGAKTLSTHYNRVTGFEHTIHDTLPVRQAGPSLVGSFDAEFGGLRDAYLVVDSSGQAPSRIWAHTISDADFVSIGGVPDGTAYRITSGADTVSAGISDGTITVGSFPTPVQSEELALHLYRGALVHTDAGDAGMIVLDHANSESLAVAGGADEDTVYTVHAYVKIPVTGAVTINGTSMDGLALPYLDGSYSGGDSMMIPVIPTYRGISMSINGMDAYLGIADVLGGTGLRITDPVSSTISVSQDRFVDSIQSTAGIVAYAVAPTDGRMKAHVRAEISGVSEITNTRTYFENTPPPPPPPRPRDPLTLWIEVYVNGQLREIDGRTQTQIFFSDTPGESHQSGASGSHSTFHTARFSYPDILVFDSMSVPVEAADFVEFYFYNQIEAHGSVPPLPSGFHEHAQHGRASATATMRYASINTGM